MSAGQARFDHVGISVANLEDAARWYCGALELSVETQFAVAGTDLSGTMLRHASGYRVELLHRPDAVAGPQADSPLAAAGTRGYGHMCLCVTDVDAAYEQLIAAGATMRMPPSPSPRQGARVAFVADPEGNLIELLDRKD